MITLSQCYELKFYVEGLIEDFKNETWDNKHRQEILGQMINVMNGAKARPNRNTRKRQKYHIEIEKKRKIFFNKREKFKKKCVILQRKSSNN